MHGEVIIQTEVDLVIAVLNHKHCPCLITSRCSKVFSFIHFEIHKYSKPLMSDHIC